MSNAKSVNSKDDAPMIGNTRIAEGGELHQLAGGEHSVLTTNQGLGISDNQNSLKANPSGPVLLEDFILREKITHFDHERIPERIVHARGKACKKICVNDILPMTFKGNYHGHKQQVCKRLSAITYGAS